MKAKVSAARRIVVKIGSALLVDQAAGKLKRAWLASLGDDIAALKSRGSEVVIVSSGAIPLGRRMLGLPKGPLKLEEKQAAAAVGQIALAHAWQQMLAERDIVAGQVLLTLNDTEARRRYLNARATLFTLLKAGAIPVINENDTVATSEIRYGDNDRLAARVTAMLSGDCLVLLSDIDGLYTAPPGTPGAERVREVREITPAIEAMAGKPVSGVGSGGMITKIEAAKIALAGGARMVIASGHEMSPLSRIDAAGTPSTWFLPSATPLQARKRWIAGTLVPVGRLQVDAGAAKALLSGKSLLPAGVRAIDGTFSRGDPVSIHSDGQELARGLIAYDRHDAERIIGRKSQEIEGILGYRGRDELIHRDDLVVLTGRGEP
ncbi:MAG: glutamate 5-kinase [Hyphomicrobiales bacterium]